MATRYTYAQTSEDALIEMFRRVGEDYAVWHDTICREDAEWYNRKTWTGAEAADFRAWLTAKLRKRHRMRKRTAELEAAYFDLMWGWRTTPSGQDGAEDKPAGKEQR